MADFVQKIKSSTTSVTGIFVMKSVFACGGICEQWQLTFMSFKEVYTYFLKLKTITCVFMSFTKAREWLCECFVIYKPFTKPHDYLTKMFFCKSEVSVGTNSTM